MIKVDRSNSPPDSLKKKYRDDKTELDRVIDHIVATGSPKGFEYSRYKSSDVKTLLEQAFHGKCAYCESPYGVTQPVDVEHFRPKGKVEGVEHAGYWWLAMDWDNLLPSCIDCNRRRGQEVADPADDAQSTVKGNAGKKDLFPLKAGAVHAHIELNDATVAGLVEALSKSDLLDKDEAARLLIDPTREDPNEFLEFRSAGYDPDGVNDMRSWARPRVGTSNPDKAEQSIAIYGLNRLALLQARGRILLHMELLFDIYLDLVSMRQKILEAMPSDNAGDLDRGSDSQEISKPLGNELLATLGSLQDKIEREIKEMQAPQAPYSAAATAWVKQKRAFLERFLRDYNQNQGEDS